VGKFFSVDPAAFVGKIESMIVLHVIAGLDPAIQGPAARSELPLDARLKAGHDEWVSETPDL